MTVLRLDTAIAFYDRGAGGAGSTVALMPSAGYKFTPNFMGLLRWGVIGNSAPIQSGLAGSASITNILLGGTYARQLPAGLRIACFLGATVPIGSGGSASPTSGDPNVYEANKMGLYAREAMDNVLFSPNDVSLVPGIDFGYVGHRVTFQVEFTLLQLMRVRNELAQVDAFRTNSTLGMHVGYFVSRRLSLAAELRYQRFLTTPAAVAKDETLRDNLSLALGARVHFKVPHGWLRPSIAYAPGLYGYLYTNSYHVLLIDIPYAI